MKKIVSFIILSVSAVFMGCEYRIVEPDVTPPSIPQGISTIAEDGQIEIFWISNTEPDLAGYNIYVSYAYDGRYQLLGSTTRPYFLHHGANNGQTYYYALSAYDVNGNESVLTPELISETPRPEGYAALLRNFRDNPALGGYDFSTYSVGPYNDQYTDVYFEFYNGVSYFNVWEDTDIQDMGYTNSLDDIAEAPTSGWSPTKDVIVIPGHTYVIWTWDNHYAKVRVTEMSSSRVKFDWAYQLQKGNPRLKQSVIQDRKTLQMGDGAKSRLSK
jgi:hypothetical protein